MAALTRVDGHEVRLINDAHFARVRRQYHVDSTVLDNFKFEQLDEAGGKGGDVLAFTPDRKFIVKSLNDSDQVTLENHSAIICAQMVKSDSLLSKMFFHFQIPDGDNAGFYFVMNNCLPPVTWAKLYDLKGCCDDKLLFNDGQRINEVHKRCFSINTFWYGCDLDCCCNTDARKQYFQGKREALTCKFDVSPHDKQVIDRRITNDVNFLVEQTVTMDYSLILGITKCKVGEEGNLPKTLFANQPYLVRSGENEVSAFYFGIIDFLQEWTTTKKVCKFSRKVNAEWPLSLVSVFDFCCGWYTLDCTLHQVYICSKTHIHG